MKSASKKLNLNAPIAATDENHLQQLIHNGTIAGIVFHHSNVSFRMISIEMLKLVTFLKKNVVNSKKPRLFDSRQ